MPTPPRPRPSHAVQVLLLNHLGAMRSDYVATFMRDNEIAGISNTKSVMLELVEKALHDRDVGWDALIGYLDRWEPYGKQRVQMRKAPASAAMKAQYSPAALKQALEAAGLGDIWGAAIAVAAPDDLKLSSVRATGHKLEVVAIGRRTYRQRAYDLESAVELPRDDLEVQLYERIEVRAWIRAELNAQNGAMNIRAVALPQERAQNALFEDFESLISAWLPMNLFAPLNLGKAIKALHDDECAGFPCEARVQAVGYDDASGRKSSLRSASANQSLNGAAPAYQSAIDAVRASGQGADGNFYFLPASQNGPASSPIGDEPVRVLIKAAAGRLDFTKPLERAELEHVLSRVRVLAG